MDSMKLDKNRGLYENQSRNRRNFRVAYAKIRNFHEKTMGGNLYFREIFFGLGVLLGHLIGGRWE